MNFIEVIILGIIQGLTEFLPISSSGHLEIANKIFNNQIEQNNLLLIIILHFGTAISTLLVFKKDIIKITKDLLKLQKNNSSIFVTKIIYSMIPAVIIGFVFENQIETLFNNNLLLVGSMLIITGTLLLLTDKKSPENKNITTKKAFLVGLAQAIAILPGISRSGATISTAVLIGINKKQAAKFSFLMVIPIIIGKIIKDFISGDIYYESEMFVILIIGFFSAFITGFIACKWMIKLVQNSNLKYFSYYCFIIGLICIISHL